MNLKDDHSPAADSNRKLGEMPDQQHSYIDSEQNLSIFRDPASPHKYDASPRPDA